MCLNDVKPGPGRKPIFHIVAPTGWMNDPCAPGFDSVTSKYLVAYQWNPHSTQWDKISWGGVKSVDMVHWQYVDAQPILVPDQPYDCQGIFTGCLHPTGPRGEVDQLSIIYTCASRLPIHWKLPHIPGSEGLAIAVSCDGGESWEKDLRNPILQSEPEHLSVTGFRDPFIFRSASLDKLLARDDGLYGVLAGGVQEGPRIFLYTIDPSCLSSWTFAVTLFRDIPRNWMPSPRFGGDFGANWECANYQELSKGTEHRQLWILGCEGGSTRPWVEEYRQSNPDKLVRDPRYLHWFFGEFERTGDKLDVSLSTWGLLDWAELYAVNTFTTPDGRCIAWGWLVELDLPEHFREEKGWVSCLGIPRELSLQVLDDVIGTLKTPLEDITSWDVQKLPNQTCRIVTLNIQPLKELTSLRTRRVYRALRPTPGCLVSPAPLSCEIRAVIAVDLRCQSVEIVLRHSSNLEGRTIIAFYPAQERLVVNRRNHTTQAEINTQDEIATHTLSMIMTADGPRMEPLELVIFLDGDTVEVFANSRTVISTRCYTPSSHRDISLAVQGKAVVMEMTVWEMGSIGLV